MKKLIVAGAALGAAILMISCPQTAAVNPYEGLTPGTFWAQNLASTKEDPYYQVESVLLAEGEKCIVWAERSAGVSLAEAAAIASEYDRNIHDKIVKVFGSEEIMAHGDMDENGKLTLFLLDIKDGFNGSGPYTAGYFFSNDLFPSTHSNGKDMIYVDTYPSRLCSPESYATIAHELQHFINFTTRYTREYNYSLMDTWVDEGLSSAAEYIYLEGHNEERVAQFSQSETVQQGNNFFVWGNGTGNSLLDDYSTVYLFFQWLRIQSGGIDIYRRIVESQHGDYQAVTGAISGDFAAALGGAPDWETTLRSWFAANYINSSTGLYGYHGELPELQVYALGGRTQKLWPGEGVYSYSTTTSSVPSGGENIKYAGLRKAAEPPVSLDTLYANGRLLTFNSNKENEGEEEPGRLTGGWQEIIPKPPSTGTGRSAWQAGDSWIIDARDIMGRPDHGDN
jgi:hypothetical protein